MHKIIIYDIKEKEIVDYLIADFALLKSEKKITLFNQNQQEYWIDSTKNFAYEKVMFYVLLIHPAGDYKYESLMTDDNRWRDHESKQYEYDIHSARSGSLHSIKYAIDKGTSDVLKQMAREIKIKSLQIDD